MIRSFIILSMICAITSVRAEIFADNVHSISTQKENEEALLYLESGRVVFIQKNHPSYQAFKTLRGGIKVKLEVDKNNNLKAFKILSPKKEVPFESEGRNFTDEEVTIFQDHESAEDLFRGMNRSYKKNTQCSDRAHVWAWEEWRKNNVVTRKVFLFFTETYIRRYRFYWWFHVAPFTLVTHEDNQVEEHVLDRKYSLYPQHMKNWTDRFIKSKWTCPVSTYRYYRENKYGSEHCYLVKTPMYYRLPYHVRMMEDEGIIKSSFSPSEVNFSYRAFFRRLAR